MRVGFMGHAVYGKKKIQRRRGTNGVGKKNKQQPPGCLESPGEKNALYRRRLSFIYTVRVRVRPAAAFLDGRARLS